MKKIFSTFLIFFIFFGSINFSYGAETCKYTSEIEECEKSTQKLSIEEFVCISGNREDMIYNIILDKKFKKIDKEADKYLSDLEKGKSQFFGPDQKQPFLVGVDEIEASFGKYGYFYEQYKKVVPEIISETIACNGPTKDNIAKDYFGRSNLIKNLIQDKLDTRKQVAYDIMNLNKQKVRKDEKKRYVQQKRTHYDLVSNLFMISIGYLKRIMNKWASKTKNPL